MFETILAIASLITSVVGGVVSYQQQENAADAQEKAQRAQRKMDEVRMARERMNALREARIRRASIIASGANQGVSESSGVQGGAQSAIQQGYQNVGFVNTIEGLTGKAQNYLNQASAYNQQANIWGSVSKMGGTIFDATGGFNTIFAKQKPAPVTGPSNIVYPS